MLHAKEFRYGFGITCVDDFIYIVGGYIDNNEEPVPNFERYDIQKDTWTDLPPCLAKCQGPCLASY